MLRIFYILPLSTPLLLTAYNLALGCVGTYCKLVVGVENNRRVTRVMAIDSVEHFVPLLCVRSCLFMQKHFMIAVPSSRGQQGIFMWWDKKNLTSVAHVF